MYQYVCAPVQLENARQGMLQLGLFFAKTGMSMSSHTRVEEYSQKAQTEGGAAVQ
jgi:hypothetical protein